MTQPVCLVTGATGAIGPRVVAMLRPAYRIRTLSRQTPPPGLFDPDIDAMTTAEPPLVPSPANTATVAALARAIAATRCDCASRTLGCGSAATAAHIKSGKKSESPPTGERIIG